MTNTRNRPHISIVSSFLLCMISIIFQLAPLLLGKPFLFLTIISVVPLIYLFTHDITYGIEATFTTFLIVSIFQLEEGLLFALIDAPITIVMGISSYKHYSRTSSILALGVLLSATLICVDQFLSIPIFLIKTQSVYTYILLALCESLIFSIVLHMIAIPIGRLLRMCH